MSDTTPQGAAVPSARELRALATLHYRRERDDGDNHLEFDHVGYARAVLARWGAPQAAALPPHVPLTDDQMREVLTDEAFAGETKSEKSKWAVHEKSMLIMIDFCRAVERAHGIAAA